MCARIKTPKPEPKPILKEEINQEKEQMDVVEKFIEKIPLEKKEFSNVQIAEIEGKSGLILKPQEAPRINVSNKIKVLWYSDFLKHTGFGNVAEEILSRLDAMGKYKFSVIGINYWGEPYNSPKSDYYKFKDIPVFPAQDSSGQLGHENLTEALHQMDIDIFFALQDTFNMVPMKDAILETRRIKDYRYIFYFPVDGDLKTEWVTEGVKIADYPVAYSKFGVRKINEITPSVNLNVIPHGVDFGKFKKFATEGERAGFRSAYFKADEHSFIITNVNRNQPRKDLLRTIVAFGEFCRQHPEVDARLYMHSMSRDAAGYRLHDFIHQYLPFDLQAKISLPSEESFGNNGYPIEVLSNIYAGSDLVTSTTLGEGWGLSTVEAMSCGTPVVMPRNSATTEIIGENEERGYLANSGIDSSHFVVLKDDHGLKRPLTDVNHLVKKWFEVYSNKEEAKTKVEKATQWLSHITWDKVALEWDKLFTDAYHSMRKRS